ncbi:hypothetical protein SAMN04515617_11647 [Collimonas sp. OK242]|jgi:Flp pilus assembly pilin Flp|nr:hypothetical protein [Collimonas sp. OK242]SDY54883.1 hypothetical protein SAMN04515617_11647 [Collimonas sp. OK242]
MRFSKDLSHIARYFLKEDTGVSLLEFALVGALIVVVCLLMVLALVKDA